MFPIQKLRLPFIRVIKTTHLGYLCILHHIQSKSGNLDNSKPWHRYHDDSYKTLQQLLKRNVKIETYVSDKSMEMLCQTFDIDARKCKMIVKHRQFETCSYADLSTMASFLKDINVKIEHILRAPWVLWKTKDELNRKFSLLNQLHLFETALDGLGFTIYDANLIKKYKDHFGMEKEFYPDHRNKIYYICDRLDLPVDLLTIKLVHAWPVFHLRKTKLDAVIKVLLDYEIKPLYIVNDVWVFLHNTQLMEERLSKMREVSKMPLKLWICRCNDFYFQRAYHKHKSGMYKNLKELLKVELDCDDVKCESLLGKRTLRTLSLSKLKQSIDSLTAAGIDKEAIRNNILILHYSPKRVIHRMNILKERMNHVPFYILTSSEEKFQNYLKELK